MVKPIEVERRDNWYELRRQVFYQAPGTWEVYEIVGSLRGAAASVRQLARKYQFKISTMSDARINTLVIFKESEPPHANP